MSNEEDVSLEQPKLGSPKPLPDPVREQKRKQVASARKDKERQVVGEKPSVISGKIEPTLSTRIGLQSPTDDNVEESLTRQKYEYPKSKKQKRLMEKNRANTVKYFCKYDSIKVPKPITSKKLNKDVDVPSPEVSQAKVAPKRATPTASRLYPYSQSDDHLGLKKPRSGIFVNADKEKDDTGDYDSFELVYSKKPRPISEVKTGRKKQRAKTEQGREQILTETDYSRVDDNEANQEDDLVEMLGEGDADVTALENYLTKQFRRKVSQISHQTSYQSKDYKSISSEKEIPQEPVFNKYIQKFRRESEIKEFEFKKRKFKRGTLESHSFTDLNQPILSDYYFGVTIGSMHQGDESFSENIRNKQGLCMSIAAYCFSILKHPTKWTSENIDTILEYGNQLCMHSMTAFHMHNTFQELSVQELAKYCLVGKKKIRFIVDEPDIIGHIRSNDKTICNITKALKIFFARKSAGIFKTEGYCAAIWKDKYYYMFDANPRTKDLYSSPNGMALLANFYDIPALASVFLGRSNFGNWPFVIHPVKGSRTLNKDDPEVNSNVDLTISHFNILNEKKAVCSGSFDIGDKCFGFSRGKQSLAMAVISLVYSRITPPSAWHRSTIDKIMLLGNHLYLECKQCEDIDELRIDNLPAFFTIGPYIVEIYIYGPLFADYLFRQCCCTLLCSLEEFFQKCTNGIVEIDKNHHLAVWKQRNMYFCFDPYSRNTEGYVSPRGSACVSMHTNLDSVIELITNNFDQKDSIVYVHALKVCKIHRDSVQSLRFPRHLPMDEIPVEEFKNYRMKKSKKYATEKPVTVDYTALAMIRLLAGDQLESSIHEIGSGVDSVALADGTLCPTFRRAPSMSVLKSQPKIVDVVADLDSPSLSDTQIPPPIPKELLSTVEEIEFLDLDSFELTMEEIELAEISPEEEGEGRYKRKMSVKLEDGDIEGEEDYFEDQGGEDDWYYAMDEMAQAFIPKEPSKLTQEVNTELTFFPIKRDILYPTYVRGKQQMKYRLERYKISEDDWDTYLPPEPAVTQSEELQKETNFTRLPDDTEIIYGTQNVADFGTNIEFIAPFVGIMAGVVSRKYSIVTWSTEIVDYILKCGAELYSASKFRFDQVSKLEIPKITLGNTSFTVLVEYIFDTYTRQNILELVIDKILFVRSDIGVLVTPVYACALFFKNHLYYLYDCFGNNEVGLGEGPSNAGTACVARFKDIKSLATRIMYNKKKREANEDTIYSRFVLSSVRVKEKLLSRENVREKPKRKARKSPAVEEHMLEDAEDGYKTDEEEKEIIKSKSEDKKDRSSEETEPKGKGKPKESTEKNKVGYQYKNKTYVIEGTTGLKDKSVSVELKEDHFICLCACLMLMTCPIVKWDTKRVNAVLDNGRHVYSHADDLDVSDKRIIKNILVDKYFFDLIVKRIKIENWSDRKNLNTAVDTLLARKLSYFMVQFPNGCYVVHKSPNGKFHLFSAYGVAKGPNAGWMLCKDIKRLRKSLKKLIKPGAEHFQFYNFEVTSIKKAPKEVVLSYNLQEYDMLAAKKKEDFGKPFYEVVEWLASSSLPWSRKTNVGASGQERGKMENMWNNWDIEYPKDLYSLMGNIHQISVRFSEKTRGKQTLANLIVSIGMMEIYELAEFNSAIIDSILVNGDTYFNECIKDITEQNYEIWMDDMKTECSIFPFSFEVYCTPLVEGTMFLVRTEQFNLYKALRYFFNNYNKRCGIICAKKSPTIKRHLAFGKLKESEYFMFDCECVGSPMFLEGCGVAYIMRMTTLNRLLHVLTLTLRGGDFYIWEIQVSELQPIN